MYSRQRPPAAQPIIAAYLSHLANLPALIHYDYIHINRNQVVDAGDFSPACPISAAGRRPASA